jgi:hypothetical protein
MAVRLNPGTDPSFFTAFIALSADLGMKFASNIARTLETMKVPPG